jgi:hypothetical protein
MSQANAAAIKRRVNAPQVQPGRPGPSVPQVQSQQQQQQQGLTLQQVISVIDKRLVLVESGLKEIKESPRGNSQIQVQSQVPLDESAYSSILEEFNGRFELLALEMNNLKDIVLKLQSYTMEVNKTLLEERIHILSDLGNNDQATGEVISEAIDNVTSELSIDHEHITLDNVNQ